VAYDAGAVIARITANPEGFLAAMGLIDRSLQTKQQTVGDLQKAFSRLGAAGTEITKRLNTFSEELIKAGVSGVNLNLSVAELEKEFKRLGATGLNAAQIKQDFEEIRASGNAMVESLSRGYKAFAVAGTAVATAIGAIVYSTSTAAARVQVLGTVMEQVGKNAGKSSAELNSQVETIKSLGITTREAEQTLIRLMQVQIDTANGAKLARVAQDLAVIANKNSSDALGDLIQVIGSQNMEIGRQYGLTKTADQIFKEYGATLGKTGISLNEVEKRQAIVNYILAEGAKVAGTYEAAMGDVGKRLTSLPRLVEDAKVAFGHGLLPVLGLAVDGISAILTWFTKLPPAAQDAASSFTLLLGVLGAVVAVTAAWALVQGKVKKAMIETKLAAMGMLTNPWFLAIAGAVALAIAIKGIIDAHKGAEEAAEKQASTNAKLSQSYFDVKAQLDKTKEGTKEHKDLESQLQKTMNDLATALHGVGFEYDELGNARIKDIKLIQNTIDKENELDRIRQENVNKEKLRRAEAAVSRAKEEVAYIKQQIKIREESGKYQGWELKQARVLWAAQTEEANTSLRAADATLKAVKAEIKGTVTPTPPPPPGGGVDATAEAEILEQLRLDRLKANKESLDNDLAILAAERKAEEDSLKKSLQVKALSNEVKLALDQKYAEKEALLREKYVKEAEDEAKARLEQFKAAQAEIDEDMLSSHDLALWRIEEKAVKFREAGIDEVAVAQWVAAQKAQITRKEQDEAAEEYARQMEEYKSGWKSVIDSFVKGGMTFESVWDRIMQVAFDRFLETITAMIAESKAAGFWQFLSNLFGLASPGIAPIGQANVGGQFVPAAARGGVIPDITQLHFAAGGMLADTMRRTGDSVLVMAKPKEMILPPDISEGLRRMIEGGGGAREEHNYFEIHAVDSKSFTQMLSDPANQAITVAHVKGKMRRDGKL